MASVAETEAASSTRIAPPLLPTSVTFSSVTRSSVRSALFLTHSSEVLSRPSIVRSWNVTSTRIWSDGSVVPRSGSCRTVLPAPTPTIVTDLPIWSGASSVMVIASI